MRIFLWKRSLMREVESLRELIKKVWGAKSTLCTAVGGTLWFGDGRFLSLPLRRKRALSWLTHLLRLKTARA